MLAQLSRRVLRPSKRASPSQYGSSRDSTQKSKRSRSYATSSDSSNKDGGDQAKDSAKTKYGPIGKRSPGQVDSRGVQSVMSILSPLNRTALDLGDHGVIVFAGAESTGSRFSSWPRPNSNGLVPPGAGRPQNKGFSISGNPTADIYNMYNEARSALGKGPKTGPAAPLLEGTPNWLVQIGEELRPGEPFLKIADVTFLHQPRFKPPIETPTLYVANFLLPKTMIHGMPAGTPLLVAVLDPNQLPRFETFKPTSALLKSLSEGKDKRIPKKPQ